jgi:hypothetical protein
MNNDLMKFIVNFMLLTTLKYEIYEFEVNNCAFIIYMIFGRSVRDVSHPVVVWLHIILSQIFTKHPKIWNVVKYIVKYFDEKYIAY